MGAKASTGSKGAGASAAAGDDQWSTSLFDDLRAGKGCKIPEAERRGITLRQVRAVLAHVQRRCGAEGWSDAEGNPLACDEVNLYEVVDRVVRPATAKRRCAYVELVAAAAQPPRWFVTHWWGDAVARSVRCLEQHANDRALGEDVAYWICSYAIEQWGAEESHGWTMPGFVSAYAGNKFGDPENSVFRRAMKLADGTLSVLDPGSKYFSRAWCAYEISVALALAGAAEGGPHHLYDVYTTVGDRAVGLTDGFAHVDTRRARFWWTSNKYSRERHFPAAVAGNALQVELQSAEASHETDRKRILNTIVGAKDLNARPPAQHERYEELNKAIRGRFAAGGWRAALESQQPLQPYQVALQAGGLRRLELSFGNCKVFTDETAAVLAGGLPASLQHLDVDLSGCEELTDRGAQALAAALPPGLQHLALDVSSCRQLQDSWLRSLAGSLKPPPPRASRASVGPKRALEHLAINLASCDKIGDAGIQDLAAALPPSLQQLMLGAFGCLRVTDVGLRALAAALPPGLRRLELLLGRCPELTDAGVGALTAALPASLRQLELDLRYVVKLSDATAAAVAEALPAAADFLKLDLIGCAGLTAAAEEKVRAEAGKRSGLTLELYCRDDCSINM